MSRIVVVGGTGRPLCAALIRIVVLAPESAGPLGRVLRRSEAAAR